jgi:hypothetical protein
MIKDHYSNVKSRSYRCLLRKAAFEGLCIRCGVNPVKKIGTRCEPCKTYHRKWTVEHYLKVECPSALGAKATRI